MIDAEVRKENRRTELQALRRDTCYFCRTNLKEGHYEYGLEIVCRECFEKHFTSWEEITQGGIGS